MLCKGMVMRKSIVRKKTVLVVEDERTVRQLIKRVLEQDEHTILESNDSSAVLEILKKHPVDLVITDLMMPGMRGDILAVKIKELSSALPVILVTGTPHEIASGNSHIDEVLIKPFTIDALRQAIAKVLR